MARRRQELEVGRRRELRALVPSKVQEDEHNLNEIDAVVGTSSDSSPSSSVVRLNIGYRDKDLADSHTIGRWPTVVDQIRNDGDGRVKAGKKAVASPAPIGGSSRVGGAVDAGGAGSRGRLASGSGRSSPGMTLQEAALFIMCRWCGQGGK